MVLRCGKSSLRAFIALAGVSFASPSPAQPGDSVQLELVGSVAPRCAFTSAPGQSSLGTLAPSSHDIGEMTFRCNLPDSPTVNLSVQSQFGALQREGGTERVNYALQWNVAGGGNAVDAQNLVSSVGFALAAGDIVAGQGGMLRVIVNGTGPLPAGTYRDRITYTISP